MPAIITGILNARQEGAFLSQVLFDLQKIVDSPLEIQENMGNLRLPQVHALNCLKQVFTHATFGFATESYVAGTLNIAAGCLECQVYEWINCESCK